MQTTSTHLRPISTGLCRTLAFAAAFATICLASFDVARAQNAASPKPSTTDAALENGTQLKLVAPGEAASALKIAPSQAPPTATSTPPATTEGRPLLPPPSSGPPRGSLPSPSVGPAVGSPPGGGPGAKPPPPANDPTVPGPAIRELLGQSTPREAGAPPAVPEMRLTSRIAVRNRPTVAVLEVGGRSVTVKEGDEFTVPIGGELVPLRAAVLTANDVQIEIVNRRAIMHLK